MLNRGYPSRRGRRGQDTSSLVDRRSTGLVESRISRGSWELYPEGVNVGKLLIYAGLGLAALGVLFIAASKLGIRPFRLPGDIVWKPTENSTIYFPIVTSIILSILLTLILSLFNRR